MNKPGKDEQCSYRIIDDRVRTTNGYRGELITHLIYLLPALRVVEVATGMADPSPSAFVSVFLIQRAYTCY